MSLMLFILYIYRFRNDPPQDQDGLNEQWKPKKTRVFTNEESNIIENFKVVLDYRKTLDAPSQYRIAREIREISTLEIGFNQSMVSRMYNNVDIHRCDR